MKHPFLLFFLTHFSRALSCLKNARKPPPPWPGVP